MRILWRRLRCSFEANLTIVTSPLTLINMSHHLIQGQLDLLADRVSELEYTPIEINRCNEIEDTIRFALGIIWQMNDKRKTMDSPLIEDLHFCYSYQRILKAVDGIEEKINDFENRGYSVLNAEKLREQGEEVEDLLDGIDSEKALADPERIPYEEVRRELGLT